MYLWKSLSGLSGKYYACFLIPWKQFIFFFLLKNKQNTKVQIHPCSNSIDFSGVSVEAGRQFYTNSAKKICCKPFKVPCPQIVVCGQTLHKTTEPPMSSSGVPRGWTCRVLGPTCGISQIPKTWVFFLFNLGSYFMQSTNSMGTCQHLWRFSWLSISLTFIKCYFFIYVVNNDILYSIMKMQSDIILYGITRM